MVHGDFFKNMYIGISFLKNNNKKNEHVANKKAFK